MYEASGSSTYAVLPSNTVCHFRRNKQNDFVTTLARPLTGENLRVRLSAITFKKSWPDVYEGNNCFWSGFLPDRADVVATRSVTTRWFEVP